MVQDLRFLHLEDDSLDAELVQAKLRLGGVRVQTQVVRTRADFLASIDQGGLDLILADYLLPDFDGLTALDLARERVPDVPFIFVTGELGEERAIETLLHGATDYVLKTHLSRLTPAVKRALAERAERRRRLAAESAAQAEHEWLRVTLASIGDAVIATDTTGRVTFVNAIAEALTGWTEAEARGRPALDVFNIVNETTRELVESPVDRVLRDGLIAGLANHTVLIRKDGTPVPIDDSGAPIRDADARLIGVVLVFRDISGRRQSEAALQEREALYRSLVDLSPDAIFIHREGIIQYINGAGVQLLGGQRAEDLVGRSWLDEVVLPERGSIVRERLRQLGLGQAVPFVETRWRRFDGDLIEVEVGAAPVMYQGQPAVQVVARDITERRQAEAEQRRQAGQLQLISDAVPALISYVDAKGRYQFNNRAYEIWFGHRREEIRGKHMREVLGETAYAAILPYVDQALAGQAVTFEREVPYRDGGTRFILAAYIPHQEGSQVLGFYVLVQDVTERKQAELERVRLLEETQRLNATLEERVAERTEELEVALEELRLANEVLEREVGERRLVEERVRRSERRLAEAQQLAHLGSWHWDVAENVVIWSDVLYAIYGLDPLKFPATYEGFLERVHPADRELAANAIGQAFRERQPFAFEHRIVRPDGTVRTLQARGEVEVDAAGQVTAMRGTGQDITDQKRIEHELQRSHEELRLISAHLEAAREEERRRISREIHDELGGALTSLKMQLATLRQRVSAQQTDPALARIEDLARSVDTTVQTVRRIATELRPAILDDFGLVAALEWQLQEFQAHSGLECHFDCAVDSVDLTGDAATAVFRVFQETLTNVARHSNATQVKVTLEKLSGALVLRVQDNGQGISQQEIAGSRSLGLLGMRERVRLLSGELVIEGQLGQGTTVLVRIPLQH